MPPALQFLVLTFAGWVNRHQDDLIAYLREENRVLREHLGPQRWTLSVGQVFVTAKVESGVMIQATLG